MPKAKTLDQIKLNLLRPALTSHFEVEIPLTQKLKDKVIENSGFVLQKFDQEKLNLLCSEASLPGSSLATLEINNDFTGVTERHVHRRIYDDRIDLTFYVSADDYLPIIFFESWMKYIVGESVEPDQTMRGVGSDNQKYFYRVRYPDDYALDNFIIRKFERDYETTGKFLEYKFIKCYPINITSIPVSYEASNLLKCTVSMTYIRYIVKGSPYSPADPKSVSDNTPPTTPTQQAYFNSINPTFQNSTFSYGGVPDFAASASGNSVYDSNSTGRNQI